MIKQSLVTLGLVAAFAVCAPMTGFAAKKEKAPAAEPSERLIPYHGKVDSVDATAKTFTIKGKEKDRVFSVTDKTTIMKDGAAADLAALTAGEEVHGSAKKTGDNWEAVKVTVGAKAKGAKKEEAKPAGAGAAKPDAASTPAEAGPGAGKPADPAAPAPAEK